jgi:transposase
VVGDGRPGLALVALSVIEQRYRAVMAVLDGAGVSEVAAEVGVSRQSVHAWLRRYRVAGLACQAPPKDVGRSPSKVVGRRRLRRACEAI